MAHASDERGKWLPLLILASAQFVMVLDSSVMNVLPESPATSSV